MLIDYVDVFHGSSETDLPEPCGIVKKWQPIKGMCGNTLPAAVLPFGRYSVCAYTAGYPSGYGFHSKNIRGKIENFTDDRLFYGFSHFHHSGTGAIGTYYNYAIVSPLTGSLSEFTQGDELIDECASPGYYACKGKRSGVRCEATVSRCAALHRYTFPQAGGSIAVNFMNDGLYRTNEQLYTRPDEGFVRVVDPTTAAACVKLKGISIYFAVYCPESVQIDLFKNQSVQTESCLTLRKEDGGCWFHGVSQQYHVYVALSLHSMEEALVQVREAPPFDCAQKAASREWEKHLSAIKAEGTPEQLQLLYTCLYHASVKPCLTIGKNPFFSANTFVTDITTLWDMYKTQLPLIFTLYPTMGKHIVETYVNMGRALGYLPILIQYAAPHRREDRQARLLGVIMLTDAFYHGIDADWQAALSVMYQDLLDAKKNPLQSATHVLDVQEGIFCIRDLAAALGETALAQEVMHHWPEEDPFDGESGLLTRDSIYYEGGRWNYSFRLMHDMEARIARCKGTNAFVALLDRFFGFSASEDADAQVFEGFNNEPDMESPYAYCFAGRHDRLCEVIEAAQSRLALGRGGLPGNDDSGGLSSCFLWNMLGIFPVAGQDLMLIGVPQLPSVCLHIGAGTDFIIRRIGDGQYVKHAVLNGKPLPTLRFSVSDLHAGGLLQVEMTDSIANDY